MAWKVYTPPKVTIDNEYEVDLYYGGEKPKTQYEVYRYIKSKITVAIGTIDNYNFIAFCDRNYSGGNVTTVRLTYCINGDWNKDKTLIKGKFHNVSKFDIREAIWMAECWVRREHKGEN